MCVADEGADCAKFLGTPVAAGRDRLALACIGFLTADSFALHERLRHSRLAIRIETLRQEIVDRDIVGSNFGEQAFQGCGDAGRPER